jgi:hypothetical protein
VKDKLTSYIDKPVIISTIHSEGGKDQPVKGYVFEVGDNSVDVMIDWGIMKTVQIAAIVKVSLDSFTARNTVLEDPPEHEDYPAAKRALFETEEYVVAQQARDSIKAKAEKARELLKKVHEAFPKHLGTESMLERAHFLVTYHYDYAPDESVTEGEVTGLNFRLAKEHMEKMEGAMKVRRPEEEVATHIRYVGMYAGRALANYPNHKEIRAWFDKAESIRQKISEKVRKAKEIDKPFEAGKGLAT